MTSANDQLQTLRQMESEGHITYQEYEDLTRRLLNPDLPDAEPETDDIPADDSDHVAEGDSNPSFSPTLRTDLGTNDIGMIVVISLAMLATGAMRLIVWPVILGAIFVLVSTLFEGWRRVTIIGATTVALLMIFSLRGPTNEETTTQQSAVVAPLLEDPSQEPAVVTPLLEDASQPIAGSLGIYVDQVSELWNTVDGSAEMTKSVTRYNEPGEYDSFLYRFGRWGRVAGAYDPANDAVYALMVTGQLSGEAVDRLYHHLCFVVAPYSPECIDAYQTLGLGGLTLDQYVDVEHGAEWELGEHRWQLEIEQNLLTIRVLSPDAP